MALQISPTKRTHIVVLNKDILRHICALARERKNYDLRGLDGLSRSSKYLRRVALPHVFRNVHIHCDAAGAVSKFEELATMVDISRHIRCVLRHMRERAAEFGYSAFE